MDQETAPKQSGCLAWLLISLLGPVLAINVLKLVYGVRRVSSASAWGLAPVMDLLVAVGLLPVLWLGLWVFVRQSAAASRLRGLFYALALYCAALVLAWGLMGGRAVLSVIG